MSATTLRDERTGITHCLNRKHRVNTRDLLPGQMFLFGSSIMRVIEKDDYQRPVVLTPAGEIETLPVRDIGKGLRVTLIGDMDADTLVYFVDAHTGERRSPNMERGEALRRLRTYTPSTIRRLDLAYAETGRLSSWAI